MLKITYICGKEASEMSFDLVEISVGVRKEQNFFDLGYGRKCRPDASTECIDVSAKWCKNDSVINLGYLGGPVSLSF